MPPDDPVLDLQGPASAAVLDREGGRATMRRKDIPSEIAMPRFEDSIDVPVPVRTAYDAWTQFEQFPQFMDGVEKVVQLDDKRLEWTATVAGREKHWTAEITDQTPDTRIAWKSTTGADNAGAVLFRPLGPDHTRVTLKLDADPEGPVETAGAAVGLLERQVKGDLERFRDHVQRTGTTDGWRGEIHGDDVRPDDAR
jgi:uncharacterized membrane protein